VRANVSSGSTAPSLAFEIASRALARPWRAVFFLFGGGICGFGVSRLVPSEYTTAASVAVDETSLPNIGALGSLVSRISGDLGNRAESPPFIASLFRSDAAQIPVLDTLLLTRSGQLQTVVEHYRIRAEGRSLQETQQRALRKMRRRVDAAFDRETGLVSINVEDEDPVFAAALARVLIQSVSDNTIHRRRSQYAALRQYADGRVREARDSLTRAEDTLTRFLTVNRAGFETPALAAEKARLEREVTLRLQTYSSANDQLEFARFNEARTTPVISTVDEPLVPYKRSWPSRTLFVLLGSLLGVGVLVALALDQVYEFRQVWRTMRAHAPLRGAKVA
jgi:uncharacterized protein involved in exopolysaccharide biosynthesis